MQKKLLEIKDTFAIKDISYKGTLEIRDAAGTLTLPKSKALMVSVKATHSGIVTKNNMFYHPYEMAMGARTMTDKYNKKVLRQHGMETAEPIGFISGAQYIDLSAALQGLSITNTLKRNAIIADYTKGRANWVDSIEFAKKIINMKKPEDYEGLGYILADLYLPDSEFAKKVLDGVYESVSVGFMTDGAVCSICKTDWMKYDMCEHQPGREYAVDEEDENSPKEKMVLIAGNFFYKEISFVNNPADENANVVNIVGYVDNDKVSEYNLGKTKDCNNTVLVYDFYAEGEKMFDLDKILDKLLKDEPATEEELEYLDSLYLEEFKTFEEALAKGEKILDEDGNEVNITREDIEDAKLSTSKRKSLPDSSFCGPGRSFPVPDFAHYTAALRMLGRYKGEGDKSKIKACVERKGKALGCTKGKDEEGADKGDTGCPDPTTTDSTTTTPPPDPVSPPVVVPDFEKKITELSDHVKEKVADLSQRIDKIVETLNSIKDFVTTPKDSNDNLNALREEMKNLLVENSDLYSKVTDLKKENRVYRAKLNAAFAVSGGDNYEVAYNKFVDMAEDQLFQACDALDFSKLVKDNNNLVTDSHVESPALSNVEPNSAGTANPLDKLTDYDRIILKKAHEFYQRDNSKDKVHTQVWFMNNKRYLSKQAADSLGDVKQMLSYLETFKEA